MPVFGGTMLYDLLAYHNCLEITAFAQCITLILVIQNSGKSSSFVLMLFYKFHESIIVYNIYNAQVSLNTHSILQVQVQGTCSVRKMVHHSMISFLVMSCVIVQTFKSSVFRNKANWTRQNVTITFFRQSYM